MSNTKPASKDESSRSYIMDDIARRFLSTPATPHAEAIPKPKKPAKKTKAPAKK
jgi:hypothetical protein